MYFANVKTEAEIKNHYRRLAFANHPDHGGDLETMKAINAAYEEALKRCHGTSSEGTDGKQHTYYYNEAHERELMDRINALLKLRMQDVEILLIGKWIWVTGNTKPYSAQLNHKTGIGMNWHKTRVCWFWHPGKWSGRNSKGDLGSIARQYGCSKFTPEEQQTIN